MSSTCAAHPLARIYSPLIRNRQSGIPIVWDSVDCISYLFEQASHSSHNLPSRLMARFELTRTCRYEAWLVGQFDRVLVTSELDGRSFCDLLQEFTSPPNGRAKGMSKITVLPNGVNIDYFAPRSVPRVPQTLVLTGKMSYHANVTAALNLVDVIMPLVWEEFPAARVQIVGQNPPRQVTNLALKYPDRVSVTGTVADVRPFLAQAALSVAPIIYGAGIQNKVLEAMAMATPVVATCRATSALSVRHEEQVLVADDPDLFSKQVIRLLRDPR